MKNIKIFLFSLVAVFSFYSCEEELEPQNTNYITFADTAYSTLVDPGSTASVSVTVFSARVTAGDRSFNLVVDGNGAPSGSYNVPSTVTIPGGSNEGTFEIGINDPNNIAQNTIIIDFASENGLFKGGTTSVTFAQSCNEVSATLDIVFDGYGSETSWSVIDELGAVVVSAPLGSYSNGQANASESFTLCQGRTYTFVIGDDYGDGLSYPNNGTYTLTVGGSVKASGIGDFGFEESTSFSVN